MSTDRELLELAAKAAGVDYYARTQSGGMLTNNGEWNPLTSDGDALRLAVKLRMTVRVTDYGAEAYKDNLFWLVTLDEDLTVETATRRAIVRAAAEIGRNIK